MGLLSPWWLLAGALAAALPIWLHLLQQHRHTPLPFASSMFFERRTETTTYQRRLKYKLLMSLRLLLLLLLAFAFAQPFLRRPPEVLNAANALHIVVIDNSFSMREGRRFEEAKEKARAALPSAAEAQVWSLSGRLTILSPLTKDKGELLGGIDAAALSDGKSNFAEFARSLRDTRRSTGRLVRATFVTDAQRTAMPPSFADLALEPGTELTVVSVGGVQPNYAIESVNAPRTSSEPSKTKVSAVLSAFNAPAAKKNVALKINGRTVTTKTADIPENGRTTVEFDGFDGPYGWLRGEIAFTDNDALPDDDRFYFATEKADPRRVLFLSSDRGSRAFFYFRAALEAGAEALFQVEEMSPAAASNVNLSNYAFIAANDPADSLSLLEGKLKSYLENGGAMFLAAGPRTAPLGKLPVVGLPLDGSVLAQRGSQRYFTATEADPTFPSLRRAERLSGIRFFEATKITAEPGPGLLVAARLENGSPLLLEKRIGEGRAIIFASSLDNVSNDLPVKPAYVPFLEQTAAYLGRVEDKNTNYTVDSYLDLRAATSTGGSVEVLGPDGQRALSLKEAATASSLLLGEAGFYEMRRPGGREELIAVNVDRRESDLDAVSRENLALWEASGKDAAAAAADPARPDFTPTPDPVQQSFWWWIALLAAVTLAAEQLYSARYVQART
jgi:hypothetical protein